MNDCPHQFFNNRLSILEGGDVMSIFVKNVLTLLNTYSEGQFLASEDPDAWDAAVIVGAKQEDTGECILSEFVQTLEHTCEQGVETDNHCSYTRMDIMSACQKWSKQVYLDNQLDACLRVGTHDTSFQHQFCKMCNSWQCQAAFLLRHTMSSWLEIEASLGPTSGNSGL